ncbi:asparaginase [Alphaproteobacteria bacterium KMM 3653]|uniref:Asparaginase n=1 Tax=Harenicola maris TaxID=2841044 RepID=A0AAP2CQ05_9RHOB|nr:asparaginase [Harenicola maris]
MRAPQPGTLILALGGTISLSIVDGTATPTENIDNIAATLDHDSSKWKVVTRTFANKNSSAITIEDIIRLCQTINDARSEYSSFVVTTGTDTLEEVAFGLDLLLGKVTTIAVTGAMRPPYASDFDGPASLHAAIEHCQKPWPENAGVFVVMGGSAIPAHLAHKRSTSRLDAFVSTKVEFETEEFDLTASKDRALPLLGEKLLPSQSWKAVDIPIVGLSVSPALNAKRYADADGLVIACPGACSMAPETRLEMSKTLVPVMPVALVSRCEDGHADVSAHYPGYIEELESLGFKVREFHGLRPEKARLKLAFELMSQSIETS